MDISIHALRGEGDKREKQAESKETDFNPRPPWGGRPLKIMSIQFGSVLFQSTPSVGRATMSMRQFVIQAIKFQSTPSVGRATIFLCISLYRSVISIHALRGEGDTAGFISQTSRSHFNPRPPWGGRQIDYKDLGHYSIISIHALRGEGDA